MRGANWRWRCESLDGGCGDCFDGGVGAGGPPDLVALAPAPGREAGGLGLRELEGKE